MKSISIMFLVFLFGCSGPNKKSNIENNLNVECIDVLNLDDTETAQITLYLRSNLRQNFNKINFNNSLSSEDIILFYSAPCEAFGADSIFLYSTLLRANDRKNRLTIGDLKYSFENTPDSVINITVDNIKIYSNSIKELQDKEASDVCLPKLD